MEEEFDMPLLSDEILSAWKEEAPQGCLLCKFDDWDEE